MNYRVIIGSWLFMIALFGFITQIESQKPVQNIAKQNSGKKGAAKPRAAKGKKRQKGDKVNNYVGQDFVNLVNDIDDYEEPTLPTFPTTTTTTTTTTTELPTTSTTITPSTQSQNEMLAPNEGMAVTTVKITEPSEAPTEAPTEPVTEPPTVPTVEMTEPSMAPNLEEKPRKRKDPTILGQLFKAYRRCSEKPNYDNNYPQYPDQNQPSTLIMSGQRYASKCSKNRPDPSINSGPYNEPVNSNYGVLAPSRVPEQNPFGYPQEYPTDLNLNPKNRPDTSINSGPYDEPVNSNYGVLAPSRVPEQNPDGYPQEYPTDLNPKNVFDYPDNRQSALPIYSQPDSAQNNQDIQRQYPDGNIDSGRPIFSAQYPQNSPQYSSNSLDYQNNPYINSADHYSPVNHQGNQGRRYPKWFKPLNCDKSRPNARSLSEEEIDPKIIESLMKPQTVPQTNIDESDANIFISMVDDPIVSMKLRCADSDVCL